MSIAKKSLVLLMVFILTIAGVWFIERTKGKAVGTISFSQIPMNAGNWEGEDIPLDEKTYQILETKDVLMRVYHDGKGNDVYLAIVYSQNNRGSFHPPEICYLGGGTKLLDKKYETVNAGAGGDMMVNKLVMDTPQGVITAWYWFNAGRKFVHNYYLQQICLLGEALQGRPLQGALIRISGPSDAVLKDFLGHIYPFLVKFFKMA